MGATWIRPAWWEYVEDSGNAAFTNVALILCHATCSIEDLIYVNAALLLHYNRWLAMSYANASAGTAVRAWISAARSSTIACGTLATQGSGVGRSTG